MRRAACPGDRCASRRVVDYWRDIWELHHVELVATFREGAPGAWQIELRDGDGAVTPWSFEAGRPVTLTVVNPPEATAVHDLTAPRWFRSVAWADVASVSAMHVAPLFDSIALRHVAGEETRAVLRFVPVESGTFEIWSSPGVTNGDRYDAIARGEVTPDFTSGDAAQGMLADVVVDGAPLALFVERDPDRDAALDADARRYADDMVWSVGPVDDVGIGSAESLDDETGLPRYAYVWSTRALTRGRAHRVLFANDAGNEQDHSFSAPSLFRDSVFRASADAHLEARLPYLEYVLLQPGGTAEVLLVPTVATSYTAFCQRGVVFGASGHPDLGTGHPGVGMHDRLTVSP